MKKPSFWRVLGAYLIDFIGIQLIGFLIAAFIANALVVGYFATKYPYFYIAQHQGWGMAIVTVLVLFVLEVCYFALLDSKLRGTFGKKCFKLAIYSKDVTEISLSKTSMAYAIDLLLIKPLGLAITSAAVVGGIMMFYPSIDVGIVGVFVFSILFPACWGSFYFAICESVWGKTLGKKLMGLQVVQQIK